MQSQSIHTCLKTWHHVAMAIGHTGVVHQMLCIRCCASAATARHSQMFFAMQDVLSRLSQEASIVPHLMQLLSPQQAAGKERAVSALALLTSHSSDVAFQCSLHADWQYWLLCLLKHEQPATRLAACVCLQNLCMVQAASPESHSTEVRAIVHKNIGACCSQLTSLLVQHAWPTSFHCYCCLHQEHISETVTTHLHIM